MLSCNKDNDSFIFVGRVNYAKLVDCKKQIRKLDGSVAEIAGP
jgi:hypothetical protein